MNDSQPKGAPFTAPGKRPEASPTVKRQTILTLGRVKQLESRPRGLNQKEREAEIRPQACVWMSGRPAHHRVLDDSAEAQWGRAK